MPSEPYSVSFDDCRRELLTDANDRCLAAYRKWRSRPGYGEVVKFVEGFTHSFLFTIEPGDILDIAERSSPPLGNVRKEEQLEYVENFTAPFALQHLFHRCIEERRSIPIWSEYVKWMTGSPISALWYQPLRDLRDRDHPTTDEAAWSRAVRWRMGKFYLSAVRELDIISKIRTRGFDIKYHILMDVLLRVDFWVGRTLICTYAPNRTYRDGRQGRKLEASDFFDESAEKFNIIHMKIKRDGAGRFWFADRSSIDDLCRHLAIHET